MTSTALPPTRESPSSFVITTQLSTTPSTRFHALCVNNNTNSHNNSIIDLSYPPSYDLFSACNAYNATEPTYPNTLSSFATLATTTPTTALTSTFTSCHPVMTPSDDDFLQSLSSLVSKEIQQCQTMLQTPTIATLPLLSPSSSASSFSSSGLSTPVTSPCATPVPFASVKIEDSEADMGALDLITFQNMITYGELLQMQLQLQQQQQQQLQEQAQYQYVKFEDLTDEQQFQLLLLQQQQAPLLGQEDFELRWDLEQADSCEDEALQKLSVAPYQKIINRPRRTRTGKMYKDKVARECSWCQRDQTPQWRNGPCGTVLCNACGLQYKNQRKKEREDKAKNSVTNLLN